MVRTLVVSVFGLLVWYASVISAHAAGQVRLEVFRQQGASSEAAQDWAKLLADIGYSGVRVRAVRTGDRVEITTRGSKASPVYSVRGMISARDRLVLPGGRFSLSDRRRLSSHLSELKQHGPEGPPKPAEKTPFGLTANELKRARGDLARVETASTKGVKLARWITGASGRLNHPLVISPSAQRAVAADDGILDELKGLSTGSVLAAVLRPAGLVMVPRRVDGKVVLMITDARDVKEIWPIGWKSKQTPSRLVPPLNEATPVQMEGVPLNRALDALQKKLDVPFLFDHNSLALKGIEPSQLKVSLRRKNSFYSSVLRRLLGQSRMKYEIRVDEAGKPFVWITVN